MFKALWSMPGFVKVLTILGFLLVASASIMKYALGIRPATYEIPLVFSVIVFAIGMVSFAAHRHIPYVKELFYRPTEEYELDSLKSRLEMLFGIWFDTNVRMLTSFALYCSVIGVLACGLFFLGAIIW